MTVLETDRLRLRLLAPEDAPFVIALVNEPGWLRFIGDRDIHTTEAALAYVQSTHKSQVEHGFALYLVERRADGAPLGLCGLVARATLPQPDLGFAFLARHQGQGHAHESAAALLVHARTRLGLGQILAITDPDNEASIRLLGKLGFREEGRVRHAEGAPESRLFVHDG